MGATLSYVCGASDEPLRPEEYCDTEAMRRFCAEQIAHYKVPQHIRFVSEFPVTVIGKIQKFVMRERMIEEINLNLERGPALMPLS